MKDDFYESDQALAEYLLFHYGTDQEVLPWNFGPTTALNYPARCVSEGLVLDSLERCARALDLGCAVGRSTFELARHFSEVVGIDYSHGFVAAAQALIDEGSLDYRIKEEGELGREAKAIVPDGIDRSRVRFEQGDAMNLREDLGKFDVVLMANLLCRLPDPESCLKRMSRMVNPGGQLIIMTPCTWMTEFTKPERWLGGFEREGRVVRTIDSIERILGPDFRRLRRADLPFLIREHARKYQWSVAEASTWIRSDTDGKMSLG